jgi:hypothetical protein
MADDANGGSAAAEEGPTSPQEAAPGAEDGWKTDKQNRQYVAAKGRSGVVYRQGEETVEEALARDGKPKDQKPRKKRPAPSGAVPKPPAPTEVDLKEIEHYLAEVFRAPAIPCATMGDEWAANHFATQGPVLARNLVAASRHNPWLRHKLEAAMLGGDDMMFKVLGMMGLASAVMAYAAPPIIWWFNPPVIGGEKAREMFGIPDKRDGKDAPAAAPPGPAPAPEAPPAAKAA